MLSSFYLNYENTPPVKARERHRIYLTGGGGGGGVKEMERSGPHVAVAFGVLTVSIGTFSGRAPGSFFWSDQSACCFLPRNFLSPVHADFYFLRITSCQQGPLVGFPNVQKKNSTVFVVTPNFWKVPGKNHYFHRKNTIIPSARPQGEEPCQHRGSKMCFFVWCRRTIEDYAHPPPANPASTPLRSEENL